VRRLSGFGRPRDTRIRRRTEGENNPAQWGGLDVTKKSGRFLPADMVGPDGILRGSFSPVASSLMFVPPTSMTRTLGDFTVCVAFMGAPIMVA
jgi:hypothetical protein